MDVIEVCISRTIAGMSHPGYISPLILHFRSVKQSNGFALKCSFRYIINTAHDSALVSGGDADASDPHGGRSYAFIRGKMAEASIMG